MSTRGPVGSSRAERLADLLRSHPQIESVTIEADASGGLCVHILVRVSLPSEWLARGVSPTGVRALEPVELRFSAGWPLRAPLIRLRPDFDRTVAHVQPGPASLPPVPCIYEGNLDELLQARGLPVVIDQLVDWLEKASQGRLINPEQGWEPVRRDQLPDTVVMDGDLLRGLVNRDGGYRFFPIWYVKDRLEGGDYFVTAELDREGVGFTEQSVGGLFHSQQYEGYEIGRALALFVWPSKNEHGELVVASSYQPETVVDLRSLRARARDYGCEGPLQAGLEWLTVCRRNAALGEWPLPIILCARRPMHLIGSRSDLELCAYTTSAPGPAALTEDAAVRTAGHRHAIAVELLQQMSGVEVAGRREWVLVGCGSVGSKIAVHLARSGLAPSVVLDKSFLSPHNAARHALVPGRSPIQTSWMGPKAVALAAAIEALGQKARPHVADVVGLVRAPDAARKVLPRKGWAVLNSTGSLVVREALLRTAPGVELPRVIETALMARGLAGLLTIEGPGRNPDSGDLASVANEMIREVDRLRDALHDGHGAIQRVEIGDGCGSPTMKISDARVSLFAAAMAEDLAALYRADLPERHGRVLLGVVEEDGRGMYWEAREVPAVVVVKPVNGSSWRIRISAKADRKIHEDVEAWPGVETGGILVGRYSEAARAFYVVDVLPAPEDSVRSPGGFVLGTVGVREELRRYRERAGDTLYCLGTWHSHLRPSQPSGQDHATAESMALARLTPSALLIRTPAGYTAVLAVRIEPTGGDGGGEP